MGLATDPDDLDALQTAYVASRLRANSRIAFASHPETS